MATYSQVCSNVGGFTLGDRFTLYVVLTNRNGDPATNKSIVDYNVYFENTSGGGTFTSNTRLYFALNGGVIKDSTSTVTGPRNGQVSIASGSITVDHNNDGTKAIGYHALVHSTSFGINGEISGTFTLITIPRASTVKGGSGNIGEQTTISISRASTSFTHTLRYGFGNLTDTIATGVGDSYKWTIPTSFYTQIPNNTSGHGGIYCDTYAGSTLVGTTLTEITATVNKETSRPTVTGTVVDTNSTTIALTGNANKLIRGKSTAKITVTPTVKNSATLKSVTIDGVATSDNTRTIANVTKTSFPVVVTDSRGYTNTAYNATASGGMVDYVDLSFNVQFFRPQPTTGEVQLTYSGNYFNGNFGAKQNNVGIEWHYRVKGASDWTRGGTITPTISGNTIVKKTISLGTNFDYQTAYEFYFYSQDLLTSFSTTASVSVGMPVYYWGKDFFHISGALTINGTTETGNVPISTGLEGISFNDVAVGGTLYKSGLHSVMVDGSWYNLINIRHRNGQGDGTKYGMQIIRPLTDLNGTIFTRAQSNHAWTGWETIYRAKSLWDNMSGTTGTVTLNETAANFAVLEIFYTSGSAICCQRVTYPNGKTCRLMDYGQQYMYNKVVSISGTSITVSSFKRVTISNGLNEDVDSIKILKVVGYR